MDRHDDKRTRQTTKSRVRWDPPEWYWETADDDRPKEHRTPDQESNRRESEQPLHQRLI